MRLKTVVLVLVTTVAWLPWAASSQEDVPFITTPDRVTRAMLALADVKASDFVLDLGSGDGRIVITAAKVHGARGMGVEIVPDLVARSVANARAVGVSERASFRTQDLFATDLSVASVITMYLLPEFNMRLRPRLLALKPGTRVVSHDWDMGEWAPDKTIELDVPDKAIGREKKSRLHLWVVPAAFQGLWCAPGASLLITQHFQRASVELHRPVASGQWALSNVVFDAKVDPSNGLVLRPIGGSRGAVFGHESMGLRVLEGVDGPVPLREGQWLTRATTGSCVP